MKENIKTTIKKELDWVTMAIPFLIILLLCISFIFLPDSSKHIIESIRTFLGEELGTYYLAVGLGAFIPVSYTHLDVYKRQILFRPLYNIILCLA